MPDLLVLVDSMDTNDGETFYVSGGAYVDGNATKVGWSTEVNMNAAPSTINAACINEAIAAVDSELSIEVGVLDNKTLFGGAVGLL